MTYPTKRKNPGEDHQIATRVPPYHVGDRVKIKSSDPSIIAGRVSKIHKLVFEMDNPLRGKWYALFEEGVRRPISAIEGDHNGNRRGYTR
jgi:hypothetical protein